MRRIFPLALFLACGTAAAQTCGWSNHFSTTILSNGAAAPQVRAQCITDNGLIIAGYFRRAGGVDVTNIARWDGTTFHPLGSGVTFFGTPGVVSCLTLYQPGGSSQPLLFAGGLFDTAGGVPAPNLAMWDGSAWHAIPGTPTSSGSEFLSIENLAVADPDGEGPQPESLIVSVSSFIGIGPGFVNSGQLWAWDGMNWTALSAANGDFVGSVAAYAPTAAPPLMYSVGGRSSGADCLRFSSTTFTRYDAAGAAVLLSSECDQTECNQPPCPVPVYSQTITFDPDAGGPSAGQLLLLGSFESAFGAAAHNLAAFDGTSWSQFAGGADGVRTLFSLSDPGTGRPSLYAAGNNLSVGGITAPNLARLDSTGWTAIPVGLAGAVTSMVPFTPPGSTPSIYVGGVTSAGVSVPGWSRLTPYGWAPIGQCLNNEVHALASFAPAGQPASLYAGGAFTTAAGQLASSLARWDGAQWSPVVNLNNHVDCMAASGQYLAIGGKFTLDNLPTGGVALYDGNQLTRLGTGMNTPVHALAWFNGQLYAGGEFTIAGGTPAVGIARWTGSAWAPLGAGPNNHVDALAVYDDGDGPALYVGGKFTAIGGLAASHIARWDGAAWSALPIFGPDGDVETLCVHDDGSGPALYIGGSFTSIGYFAPTRIGRFQHGAISPFIADFNGAVRALASFDPDGPGKTPPILAVGGDFTARNEKPAYHGALWDGAAWTHLTIDNSVLALAQFRAPNAPTAAMYFGGSFGTMDGMPTTFIADYTRCVCYANCDASTSAPILNVNDFICFLNLFAAASPAANCDGSTTPPVLNVADFNCFLNAFAAGCP